MKYELSAYELSLISGGFAVVGALLTAIVSYRLAKHLAVYSDKIKARAKLRAVFAPIQSRIRNEKIASWNDFRTETQNLFDSHAIEFERFRYYVSDCKVAEYDKACREYRNLVHSRSITAATTPRGAEADGRSDTQRYLDAVDNVLKFTNF